VAFVVVIYSLGASFHLVALPYPCLEVVYRQDTFLGGDHRHILFEASHREVLYPCQEDLFYLEVFLDSYLHVAYLEGLQKGHIFLETVDQNPFG